MRGKSRISKTIYPLLLTLSGRRKQLLFVKWLRAQQFHSPQSVHNAQKVQLRTILIFALENVPYYRDIFQRQGISAADVVAEPAVALSMLPLLDKPTLRVHADALKANDLTRRRWYYNTSGGSTGEPARFIQDFDYLQKAAAAKQFFDEWTGYVPGAPKVGLWGSERDLLGRSMDLKTRLIQWVRSEHWLNTFRMTEDHMHRFVEVINKVRPTQILAYVESAFELAQFIEREGLQVHRPKAVMTSAGTLYPHMRETIARVFGAAVFNRYGSREVGDVACECECHYGLHVNPYTHYVEVLRDDGSPCEPGESGELVVTLLTNFAMPLIRYRIGDLGVWAEQSCVCGRNWPLLQSVEGRVNSIIRTKYGAYDSVALSTLLYFKDTKRSKPFESFGRYQLVQHEIDHFSLRVVVRDEALWVEEKNIALKKLRSVLGADVRINVVTLGEILPSASGKHHYIWSEL